MLKHYASFNRYRFPCVPCLNQFRKRTLRQKLAHINDSNRVKATQDQFTGDQRSRKKVFSEFNAEPSSEDGRLPIGQNFAKQLKSECDYPDKYNVLNELLTSWVKQSNFLSNLFKIIFILKNIQI